MKKAPPNPVVVTRTPGILAVLMILGILGCADKHDPRDDSAPAVKTAQAQPQKVVTFPTSDGWNITGDLSTPTEKPTGVVVLLHQRGGSAGDWRDLSEALRLKGIAALAIDQRGTGRSLSPDSKLNNKDAPWNTSNDIDAAVKWILANFGQTDRGPNTLNVGLVGASYGANNALIYAAAHSDQTKYGFIKSMVLFSPGANYNGLDAIAPAKEWTGPIAIFYATNDQIAGLGPTIIRDTSPSHDKVTQQIDDDNHGTALLNDDTVESTVVFLARTLQ